MNLLMISDIRMHMRNVLMSQHIAIRLEPMPSCAYSIHMHVCDSAARTDITVSRIICTVLEVCVCVLQM